jgi:NAD(P)-dependent dehydrogenase (short-subunit alcohol dehydrogenase family)
MEKVVVLIAGALSGFGRATAVAFAKKGAKLVVAGRRDEAGNALELTELEAHLDAVAKAAAALQLGSALRDRPAGHRKTPLSDRELDAPHRETVSRTALDELLEKHHAYM